jgi:transcriptional regulator with XRE-family HTH domain
MATYKKVAICEVDLEILRKKSGLSLRELSRRTGIHFSNISKYENNVLVMPEWNWEKIKKALNN